MEYLKPIEQLKQSIKLYRIGVLILTVLLGVCLIAVPSIVKKENPVVVNDHGLAHMAEVEPWKITTARIEGFTKQYLSTRFEWNKDDLAQKKERLKSFTSAAVYSKYKESLDQFSGLAQNQSARSYYVLEGFGYSNAQKKVEARITRVLRIRNTGLATPLIVRLSYQDTAVSAVNPYGLIVEGVEESEVPDDDNQGAGR